MRLDGFELFVEDMAKWRCMLIHLKKLIKHFVKL